jgi:hypothetical protein
VADLEGLLEHLEPDAERGHREPEAVTLLFVPGRPDAQVGPAAAQDVERRRRLGPESGLAVVHAADHQPERRVSGMCGHVAEGRPAFEHRVLGRADAPDLEEVVHDPERVEAGRVGRLDDARQGGADGGSAAGPGERGNLQPDFHRVTPGCGRETEAGAGSFAVDLKGSTAADSPRTGHRLRGRAIL